MYARPTVDGKPIRFGVSGRLWRDSLVMFDRETFSLWSQVLGAGVAGPMAGRELDEIPSQLTTWGEWKQRHPGTLALVKPSRVRGSNYEAYHQDPRTIGVVGRRHSDHRLPGKALVLGLERDDRFAAVPLSLLAQVPVLNTRALDLPLAVFSPPGGSAAMAFERTLDGETLTFDQTTHQGAFQVQDQASGIWSWQTGECLAGPCQGKRLRRVRGTVVYWGVWAQFHPESEVIISGN